MRAAAFPVGATRATRAWGRAASSIATRAATVRVFPVPGPPTTTDRRRSTPAVAAWRWRVDAAPGRRASSSSWSGAMLSEGASVERPQELVGESRFEVVVALEVEPRAVDDEGCGAVGRGER